MKAMITGIEIYDDADDLICTLEAFDDIAYTVEWKSSIPMPEQLRFVADLLEEHSVLFKPLEEM